MSKKQVSRQLAQQKSENQSILRALCRYGHQQEKQNRNLIQTLHCIVRITYENQKRLQLMQRRERHFSKKLCTARHHLQDDQADQVRSRRKTNQRLMAKANAIIKCVHQSKQNAVAEIMGKRQMKKIKHLQEDALSQTFPKHVILLGKQPVLKAIFYQIKHPAVRATAVAKRYGLHHAGRQITNGCRRLAQTYTQPPLYSGTFSSITLPEYIQLLATFQKNVYCAMLEYYCCQQFHNQKRLQQIERKYRISDQMLKQAWRKPKVVKWFNQRYQRQ